MVLYALRFTYTKKEKFLDRYLCWSCSWIPETFSGGVLLKDLELLWEWDFFFFFCLEVSSNYKTMRGSDRYLYVFHATKKKEMFLQWLNALFFSNFYLLQILLGILFSSRLEPGSSHAQPLTSELGLGKWLNDFKSLSVWIWYQLKLLLGSSSLNYLLRLLNQSLLCFFLSLIFHPCLCSGWTLYILHVL